MIQIDCFDISQIDRSGYETLYALADPERRLRADRCLTPEDKLRCVAAGALLRRAAAAMGLQHFSVEKSPDGKPYISAAPDFRFNISHSGRWAVIAHGGSPVGIDVERIRSDVQVDKLARRYFSPREQAYVSGDRERFFEIWTAKESYLKFLGTGLRRGLDSFCVLSGNLEAAFFQERLEDSWLTLCTTEDSYRLSRLTLLDLLL